MTEDLDHIQDKVPYKELIPFAESIHADRILRKNNEKMRQDFTANVSHELKTPLTSISGYAELIETGIAKPEDVPGFAQKIHGEASRMIQLVNDILQLSSLDNASETSSMPEMEVVDLLDVVKECVERQKLNARHAYITLTYLGESAPVRGNRNLLDELCQNLCDNAIRYNRPGGKVQIVTACTRDGHCSLTVTDNGIGIPRESQSSVFERFYRVDKSRSKATGGTGLGLAIVKHIALIHGARIKLESQVDVGTTITGQIIRLLDLNAAPRNATSACSCGQAFFVGSNPSGEPVRSRLCSCRCSRSVPCCQQERTTPRQSSSNC